jgi:hypothetical protein
MFKIISVRYRAGFWTLETVSAVSGNWPSVPNAIFLRLPRELRSADRTWVARFVQRSWHTAACWSRRQHVRTCWPNTLIRKLPWRYARNNFNCILISSNTFDVQLNKSPTICLVCKNNTLKKRWISALLQKSGTKVMAPMQILDVKPGHASCVGRAAVRAGLSTPAAAVATCEVLPKTPLVLIPLSFRVTWRPLSPATTIRVPHQQLQFATFFLRNAPVPRRRSPTACNWVTGSWETLKHVTVLLQLYLRVLHERYDACRRPCSSPWAVHFARYYTEKLSFTSTTKLRTNHVVTYFLPSS